MSTWEERMAARAKDRARERERVARGDSIQDEMAPWRHDDDPYGILPEILAARCLGIKYGDPGPVLDPEMCRQCWGDRHVWLGNCWGLQHVGGSSLNCQHPCHEGEIWLAATG